MTNQDQTQQLRQAINGFAAALNDADLTSAQDFFTEEGKFMPQGFRTLNAQELQLNGNSFLAANTFHIAFNIQDISIENDFATIIAEAKTNQKNRESAVMLEKTSRDFFVFRKIGDVWKIHRYIFNNVILN